MFDSLTIFENVAYPLSNPPDQKLPDSEVEARVKEALDFVGLQPVNQCPTELSDAIRRRVGTARAVVTTPPLILYDSPTAGLDLITADRTLAFGDPST